MKRFMIGLAAVMLTSAAWSQAPAQETGAESAAPFQCTVGITDLRDSPTQVLTTKLKTVDACRSWVLEATRLDLYALSYELLVNDADGKVVVHQACKRPTIGTSHSAFTCKDVAA